MSQGQYLKWVSYLILNPKAFHDEVDSDAFDVKEHFCEV